MIEKAVRDAVQEVRDNPTAANLDVVVELFQRFLEYLDELETAPLRVCSDVMVKVSGSTIKFKGIEDVAEWITSSK